MNNYSKNLRDITTSFSRNLFVALFVLFLMGWNTANAQFQEPEIKKVTHERRAWFENHFKDIKWTGQGLYRDTNLDDMNTGEIRSRLQAVFGDPTQKLEDLIHREGFRPGQAIQFEYWFTVDDTIPMMVLDIDGPFGRGLVFGGASRYIDLMPQVKRTFARKLLEVENPANYHDYFYSVEKGKWFSVKFENGDLKTEEVKSPAGMSINF